MTPRRSLDVQLNAALLEFAPRYMKDQLELLARECDQRLERELLPRLQDILRQVQQERDAFEERKRYAARDLREHLNLLRVGNVAAEEAIAELHSVSPRYLALFPSESSLALPLTGSPSTSLVATPSTTTSPNDVFNDTPGTDVGNHDAASPASTPETTIRDTQHSTPQSESWASPTRSSSLDHQIQSQVMSESSMMSESPKRATIDHSAESESPYKRQKTTNEKVSVKGRVAFPNLMTGECIFHHAHRKGFFVIRCDQCEPGIFTKPPLKHNRALKHFQEHEKDTPRKDKLTNDSIFERFALQVDGDEMASKYWIREHLGGAEPHTFLPANPSQRTSQTDHTEDTMGRYDETDDKFSSLPKLRESARSRPSDHEREQEKRRRSSRNVPRQDYAEMIAAPWTALDLDDEKPRSKPVKIARPIASTKRRLTKPGVNPRAGPVDSKKPFGYMSEPWPRRSAPR
ncbi:hypothetical protein F5Y03DRAFT_368182 [Xylaria venustula]|nr:hypothetical protein F5Y03DRAFT_368182 [Xylaria venustula]